MIQVIIVYYSLEGNTKYIADSIAEMLDADILNLEGWFTYTKKKES